MKFRTVDDRVRISCNSGDRDKVSYIPHIESDGTLVLEPNGKIDTYSQIQAEKNSVDIHKLIERYQVTGDRSVFDRATGIYADVSAIPTNYADILNMRYRMESEFASLPAEYRAKFDNDINKYVAQYGSDVWFANLGMSVDKPAVDKPVGHKKIICVKVKIIHKRSKGSCKTNNF